MSLRYHRANEHINEGTKTLTDITYVKFMPCNSQISLSLDRILSFSMYDVVANNYKI